MNIYNESQQSSFAETIGEGFSLDSLSDENLMLEDFMQFDDSSSPLWVEPFQNEELVASNTEPNGSEGVASTSQFMALEQLEFASPERSTDLLDIDNRMGFGLCPSMFEIPTESLPDEGDIYGTQEACLINSELPSSTYDPDADRTIYPSPPTNFRQTSECPTRQRKKSKARRVPYAIPQASEILKHEQDSFGSPKRKNRQLEGVNRETGQLTLVGKYPPIKLGAELYACPHPSCISAGEGPWSTKNGYKYHLLKVCPQNPDSRDSMEVKEGKSVRNSCKNGEQYMCCDCGKTLTTKNGYDQHRGSNPTTRNGLCALKRGGSEVSIQVMGL